MIKKIVSIKIPYWYKKKVEFDLYWRGSELRLTVWLLHKVDYEGYENEWFSNKWKHFIIYKK